MCVSLEYFSLLAGLHVPHDSGAVPGAADKLLVKRHRKRVDGRRMPGIFHYGVAFKVDLEDFAIAAGRDEAFSRGSITDRLVQGMVAYKGMMLRTKPSWYFISRMNS